MNRTSIIYASLFIPIFLIACFTMAKSLLAQPGTEADPVVSLSYLNSALSMNTIVLEGGEDLKLPSGRGIILLEGQCRINPPAGSDSWIVNVTSGEIFRGQVDLKPGSLYTAVSADGTALFGLLAMGASTIAAPGSIGISGQE